MQLLACSHTYSRFCREFVWLDVPCSEPRCTFSRVADSLSSTSLSDFVTSVLSLVVVVLERFSYTISHPLFLLSSFCFFLLLVFYISSFFSSPLDFHVFSLFFILDWIHLPCLPQFPLLSLAKCISTIFTKKRFPSIFSFFFCRLNS